MLILSRWQQKLKDQGSNTQNTQLHEVCSYNYIVVRCDSKANSLHGYRGPNAAEDLLRRLQEEEKKIKEELGCPKPMIFTMTMQLLIEMR